MRISEIPVPEVYKESSDFRFFLKWFENSLQKIKYDTENIFDLYDPLRCKSELLWMLADTMGFKFDDRLPVAFNRLILLYFMAMIKNKGSKNGVMLAAEVNLAQFNINEYGKQNEILYDRLEDTSIPVNAVYVTPHVEEGYIDVVYFSASKPVDACIEYVRPVGMYCFQHAGVRVDSRTKISIDARLTNINEVYTAAGPTRVGHYRRSDYASMQRANRSQEVDSSHKRRRVYRNNKDAEQQPTTYINPGYRTLYSLQLCNNEHIVKSMIPQSESKNGEMVEGQIFGLGYGPLDVRVHNIETTPELMYNLVYNKQVDEDNTYKGTTGTYDVSTSDSDDRYPSTTPAVNPTMASLGDAIQLNDKKSYSDIGYGYTHLIDDDGDSLGDSDGDVVVSGHEGFEVDKITE